MSVDLIEHFEIGVLGPVVLRADGIELALGAPKVRGVLALLAPLSALCRQCRRADIGDMG